MLSSPDYKLLQKEGAKVEEAMNKTKGIFSVLKTWDIDKVVYYLKGRDVAKPLLPLIILETKDRETSENLTTSIYVYPSFKATTIFFFLSSFV